MPRFSPGRLLVAIAIAVGVATASASMQSPAAPPSPPSTPEELQWLQSIAGKPEPVYAALDKCAQLLGNAGSAWQLTPQNVPECEAGRSVKSPIGSINLEAVSCWATIGKVIIELNTALAEYRKADAMRQRPEAAQHFQAGNERSKAALDLVQGLKACVQQVRTEGDNTVRRLRGAVSNGGSGSTQPLINRLIQGQRLPPTGTDPNVLGVIGDGRNVTRGIQDGAQECLADFASIAGAVAQLIINNKWGELDHLLGVDREGWGPVLKRWLDDAVLDIMRQLQEQQGLPPNALQAAQMDYQRGRLAAVRLCSYGAAGGAARLAEAGVSNAGGAVLQRIAAAARNSASQRVRLAASVAENVVAQEPRTLTVAQQVPLAESLTEMGRVEASQLSQGAIDQAFEYSKALAKSIMGKLEGDTLYLPGTVRGQYLKATLGKELGRGSFGAVFEVMENGRPGPQVLKVIGAVQSYRQWNYQLPPGTSGLLKNFGGDSLVSQVEGATILREIGVPTPKIGYWYAARNTGEFSFALMERIDTGAPNIDVWAGTRFTQAAKRDAIVELYRRLAAAGHIAADLRDANVYFVREGGVLKAGVWDADLIMSVPLKEDAASVARLEEVLEQAAARNHRLPFFQDIDFRDPVQAMENIRKIQWGF